MKKMSLKEGGGPFDLLLRAAGFDLLLRAAEKASNGDQDLESDLLTVSVIEDFINRQYQKAMEGALSVVREEEKAFQKQIDSGGGSQFVHLCFQVPKKPRGNRSLKRRFFTQPTIKEEDDDYNYEKEEKNVMKPLLKKQRRASKYDDQVGVGLSDLPVALKDEIDKMKGMNVSMVMQKKLTATDMDTAENRLSLPRTKIKNEFLREEERKILDSKGGIRVCLIDPCLQLTTNLQLKKWKMGNSFLYALIGNWSSISHNVMNQLQPDSEVQLWSFRVDSNLCFALVKV